MSMKMIKGRNRSVVQEFLLEFTVDINMLEGALVVIDRRVFLVDKTLLKTARVLQRQGMTPYALGVEIGRLHNGFLPSIELADVICELTDAKTVINEQGEKLFSYGRDVFVQNIIKGDEGYQIVMNKDGEVLGLGFFDGDMLKNVIDKGFYLRGKRGR
jgi:ribosome biogenesis protein Nip4